MSLRALFSPFAAASFPSSANLNPPKKSKKNAPGLSALFSFSFFPLHLRIVNAFCHCIRFMIPEYSQVINWARSTPHSVPRVGDDLYSFRETEG